MRTKKAMFVLLLSVLILTGCAFFARTAAKYWTKQQIKEFTQNCEKNAGRLLSAEKAADYCDCAVDIVAEKYRNYNDLKSTSLREVLQIARDCKE